MCSVISNVLSLYLYKHLLVLTVSEYDLKSDWHRRPLLGLHKVQKPRVWTVALVSRDNTSACRSAHRPHGVNTLFADIILILVHSCKAKFDLKTGHHPSRCSCCSKRVAVYHWLAKSMAIFSMHYLNIKWEQMYFQGTLLLLVKASRSMDSIFPSRRNVDVQACLLTCL